jgi:hypothetical protein
MTGAVVFSGDVAGASIGVSSERGATDLLGNGVSEVSGAGSSMITMSEPGREITDDSLSAAGSEAEAGTVVDGEVAGDDVSGTVVAGTLGNVHEWS